MTKTLTPLPAPPEGVKWTLCSLSVLDPSLTMERYEELLRAAGRLKSASSFWIGDLILFGEARYGERYAQAINVTGLREGTLANYASVARQVAPSRRREALSFAHHEAVAKLEPADQDAWLGRAEDEGWTRDDLREAIRSAGRLVAAPPAEPQAGKTSRAQEVLDSADVVEAARDIRVVHEALTLTHQALEGATVAGLEERLPEALRALEAVGKTVTAAAQKMATPSLKDAGERLVRQATRSSGFAMVPLDVFEAFVTALQREGR